MDSFGQIAITAIGVLGSASIWKYFESRLKVKAEQRKNQRENSDTNQYRDDLKNRVKNLESLLAQSSDEKEEMRKQILNLTAEVHELRVKVEFLSKENQRLANK